ncbi:MAG: MFS transporter [Candidatus Korobacteraceae bacterium]
MSIQNIDRCGSINKARMTYTEFLDNSPMTKFLWLLVGGMSLAQLLDGLDFQATAFALPGIIREFRLNPAQAGGIASMGNIGLAIGSIAFPLLCDRIGRKLIFQWVILTYAAGTLISAMASSVNVLLCGRFIAGLGLGAQLPIVFAILAEYSPLKWRHILVPLAPIFWALGWIAAALLSILLIPHFGWRAIYWVGVLPALLTVYVRYGMPESVRFLLARGKVQEAGAIVHDMAKKAGMGEVELVPPPTVKNQVKVTFKQQFATLGMVWGLMLMLSFFYFCSFIQTFGVTAWLPTIFVRQGFRLTTSFWYTLMIMAVTPFSHIIAMWLQNVLNRKWALFLMTTGGTIFFILFGLSFQYKWPVPVLVGSQILQTLSAQGVIAILFTLTSELFPNSVRTLGIGIVSGVGRFGAILGPLLMGIALKSGMKISQVIYVFAIPLFVAAVMTLFVIKVDTRERSLESIGEDGNKAMAVQGGN